MTQKPTFDYDRFVDSYRAACAERGIDPARGATGYQVVHVTAERRRTAHPPDCWWQRHDLWLNCPPYHSDTEQQAVWNLFAQAYVVLAIRLARALRLRTEGSPGRRHLQSEIAPLRDLHRKRASGER